MSDAGAGPERERPGAGSILGDSERQVAAKFPGGGAGPTTDDPVAFHLRGP